MPPVKRQGERKRGTTGRPICEKQGDRNEKKKKGNQHEPVSNKLGHVLTMTSIIPVNKPLPGIVFKGSV